MKPPRLVEAADVRRDASRAARPTALDRARGRAAPGRTPPGSRRGLVARTPSAARHLDGAAGRPVAAVEPPGRRARAARPRACPAANRPTRSRGSGPSDARSSSICSPVSSAEWFSGSPGDRQAPALDRVGEDHRRPVGSSSRAAVAPRACRRGRGRRGRAPAAPARRRVRVEQRRERRRLGAGPSRTVARTTSSRAPKSDWYCSFGISSIRPAQQLAAVAGERLAQPAPVLQPRSRASRSPRTAPAARPPRMPGNHAVEATGG